MKKKAAMPQEVDLLSGHFAGIYVRTHNRECARASTYTRKESEESVYVCV
jgi:hypothetical protein